MPCLFCIYKYVSRVAWPVPRMGDAIGIFRMGIWLLGCMRLDQLTADVITLNSAMSSCQGEKQWQTSLLLQSERPSSTCSPATYSSAIGACDASHWWLAAALSTRMRHENVEPNALSCAAVMSSWADAVPWLLASFPTG